MKFIFFIFINFFIFLGIFFSCIYILKKIENSKLNKKIEEELPFFISNFINSLKAGKSTISFFMNYTNLKLNLNKILSPIIKNLNAGKTLSEALQNQLKTQNSKLVNHLFSIVIINNQTGGNISDVLIKTKIFISNTLRLRKLIITKTISLRIQSFLIALIPIVIIFSVNLMIPDTIFKLLHTSIGVRSLIIILFLLLLGFYLVIKLCNRPLKSRNDLQFALLFDLVSISLNSGLSLLNSLSQIRNLIYDKFLQDFEDKISKGYTLTESISVIKKYLTKDNSKAILFVLNENINHGVPIKDIFQELRDKIIEDIEYKVTIEIEKLPIKLLFPIMFLIAPATLLSILMIIFI